VGSRHDNLSRPLTADKRPQAASDNGIPTSRFQDMAKMFAGNYANCPFGLPAFTICWQ
jgi:hypothetical protein